MTLLFSLDGFFTVMNSFAPYSWLMIIGILVMMLVSILLALGVIKNRFLLRFYLLWYVNRYGYDYLATSHYVALFVKALITKEGNTVEQISATHEIDGRYLITCVTREYGWEQFYFVFDKSGSYTFV